MNSRAASAASSRRVKQELVRLLFGKEATSSTATNSNKEVCRSKILLDHSVYSHTELRSAFLQRIQVLHPDKLYSEKDSNDNNNASYATRHGQFVELQEAWDRYDEMAKMAKTVDREGRADKERNFTMFGVGCSFSDSEAEREMRNEITDQACRGWFSSGSLADSSGQNRDSVNGQNGQQTKTPLTSLLDDDDDMFVAIDTPLTGEIMSEALVDNTQTSDGRAQQQQRTPKPSLVDSKYRPRSARG